MGSTDFEKRAEQLRSQMEELRGSFDELYTSYNRFVSQGADWLAQAQKPMRRAAQQARENVEGMRDNLSDTGFPWWIPVAAICCFGVGYWLYNMFTSGADHGTPFGNVAGQQRGMNPSQTFGEPR